MRAVALLLVLLLALPWIPAASADLAVPTECTYTTKDDEVCVGQARGCTGVMHQNVAADRYVCVGVYAPPAGEA